MKEISFFIKNLPFGISIEERPPWYITGKLSAIILDLLKNPGSGFTIHDQVAIHDTAVIENGATIKGPAIISSHCFVAANAYLRGGVILDRSVTIGPGCEVKSSLVGAGSTLAHFNFIGDSMIGSHVNFEAGSLIANHFNERTDKRIFVFYRNQKIDTGVEKFGALVGDGCRIGANAVLSPGTVLPPDTIVKRMQLIEQI